MKATLLLTAVQNGTKRIPMGLLFAVAVMFPCPDATAASPAPVNLGAASDFSILAGSQIFQSGASTIFTGDVGLSPASGANIGLLAAQVPGGTIYAVDALGPVGSVNNPGLLSAVKGDLLTAYNDAAGRTLDAVLVPNADLGGLTLFPNLFSSSGTLAITGTLTLDAQNDPNAVFIFQMATTLTTSAGAPGSPGSRVNLINGATADNVFWQVGSSAIIGTYSVFMGTIMADQSITMNTGATLEGRALAQIAAVSLDGNTITIAAVPEPGAMLLLGFGLAILFAFRRRFYSPA